MSRPRLRFAPSPTGMFHVGSARSALFNWLYVQRFGGELILRIEDTDESRNSPQWVAGITDALDWLGITIDEGPTFQSEFAHAHRAAMQLLLDRHAAYYCDCTRETIDARAKERGGKPGYDGHCRDRALEASPGSVVRFRVPPGETIVHDLVRGDVEFANETIEDFVVLRSSGVPMFVLANVVDDATQRITHVVRGEEHLPNAPKQLLVWKVLWPELAPPKYAHLPVIVNEKRQKLSKRRDKVSLESFRDEGYLPEAMRNYLALLGWSPGGDREIVPLSVLIDEFDFAKVQKSSAFFDEAKLRSFNGDYIRSLPAHRFVELCQPFIARARDAGLIPHFDGHVFSDIAPLVQERVAILGEAIPMVRFLFVDQLDYTEVLALRDKPGASDMLAVVREAYETCEWYPEALHDATLQCAERLGLKLGKAQAPIRAAVTGAKVGPPLFESMHLMGREKVLDRLRLYASA